MHLSILGDQLNGRREREKRSTILGFSLPIWIDARVGIERRLDWQIIQRHGQNTKRDRKSLHLLPTPEPHSILSVNLFVITMDQGAPNTESV